MIDEYHLLCIISINNYYFIFQAAPKPWPFNPDNFLSSLEYAGPQLTCGIKGDWNGLYKQFIRSPNFNGWFNVRYKGMLMKLQVLQIEALASVVNNLVFTHKIIIFGYALFVYIYLFNTRFQDIKAWIEDKKEVELVDMILKIRQKLELCENKGYQLNKKIKDQLKVKMNDIISSLPDDLKNVLSNANNSPNR